MSAHDSDSEKAPSHRSESPDQEQSEDGRLPECNPSNFNTNATTSSSRSAKKAQKKPKTAVAATSDDSDDPDVQTPANTDTRPGGGFINPDGARGRERRMKWNADNDRQLLIFGLGRDVSGKEYKAIASSFPERPTPKAVQERLTKLRGETRDLLKKWGIYDPDTDQSNRREPGAFRSRSTGHAASSPPLDLPPKKKQARQSAATPTSAPVTQPPPPPQGGVSNLRSSRQSLPAPGLNLPPHMLQAGSQFSPVPAGRGRASTFPVGPHSAAHMQSLGPMGSQPAISPHASTANMGLPQMGAGQLQPYAPWTLPQNAPMFTSTGASTGSNQFQYGQSQMSFGFTPEKFVLPSEYANLPGSTPAAPPANPSVPDAEEPAEEHVEERVEEAAEGDEEDAEGEDEEEDQLVAQQRVLDAKRAQRDAERKSLR